MIWLGLSFIRFKEKETDLGRGGQRIGSIWGHGSYLAPDWTADVFHRWGLATAGVISQHTPQFSEADLQAWSSPDRARLQAQVSEQFKPNRDDPQSAELTLTSAQSQGLTQIVQDYQQLLAHGSRVHSIPDGGNGRYGSGFLVILCLPWGHW